MEPTTPNPIVTTDDVIGIHHIPFVGRYTVQVNGVAVTIDGVPFFDSAAEATAAAKKLCASLPPQTFNIS